MSDYTVTPDNGWCEGGWWQVEHATKPSVWFPSKGKAENWLDYQDNQPPDDVVKALAEIGSVLACGLGIIGGGVVLLAIVAVLTALS